MITTKLSKCIELLLELILLLLLLLFGFISCDVNLRHNLALAYYVVGRREAAYKLAMTEMSRNEADQTFNAVRRYRASR